MFAATINDSNRATGAKYDPLEFMTYIFTTS